MESRINGTAILRGFEARARARPCTHNELENLEREFEQRLCEIRTHELPAASDVIAETLQAAEAVRTALRRGLIEHDKARSEVLRIRELTQAGQIREAVIESAKARSMITVFSDLNLDFVAEARERYDRRHRLLAALGAIATAGLLIAATVFELIRRGIPNK